MASFEYADASKVTEQLWIGGDLSTFDKKFASAQLRELVDHGLTHILDVREEWSDEDHVARAMPELTYFWQGIPDLGQAVGADWFDAGVDFALSALESPDNVVFAHCHAGINRGPSIGFAILLALGHDPIEALEEIRRARPIVMVAYAEDALRWAHGRLEMANDLETDLTRVGTWRMYQRTDLLGVLRLQRDPHR